MAEKLAQKVNRLAQELENAKEQIAACNHDFLDPQPATR